MILDVGGSSPLSHPTVNGGPALHRRDHRTTAVASSTSCTRLRLCAASSKQEVPSSLHAPLAQLAERRTLNPQVLGSSPRGRTNQLLHWKALQLGERTNKGPSDCSGLCRYNVGLSDDVPEPCVLQSSWPEPCGQGPYEPEPCEPEPSWQRPSSWPGPSWRVPSWRQPSWPEPSCQR